MSNFQNVGSKECCLALQKCSTKNVCRHCRNYHHKKLCQDQKTISRKSCPAAAWASCLKVSAGLCPTPFFKTVFIVPRSRHCKPNKTCHTKTVANFQKIVRGNKNRLSRLKHSAVGACRQRPELAAVLVFYNVQPGAAAD